jgi:site-specific DNA-cytosine methylase
MCGTVISMHLAAGGMRTVSLFTGAGGLDIGLKRAGHEILLMCENDPGAQQVLRRAFPGVPLIPDVCQVLTLPPNTELLAAGFPCVDISRAGLRRGLSGAASGLVRHVFRLLQQAMDEHRPVPWVLLENVEALLDRAGGKAPPVQMIVESLEGLGYNSWAQRVVCSAGFGTPNRRKRVLIVASLHGDARDVLLSQGRQVCVGGCCCAEPSGHKGRRLVPLEQLAAEEQAAASGSETPKAKEGGGGSKKAGGMLKEGGGGSKKVGGMLKELISLADGWEKRNAPAPAKKGSGDGVRRGGGAKEVLGAPKLGAAKCWECFESSSNEDSNGQQETGAGTPSRACSEHCPSVTRAALVQ